MFRESAKRNLKSFILKYCHERCSFQPNCKYCELLNGGVCCKLLLWMCLSFNLIVRGDAYVLMIHDFRTKNPRILRTRCWCLFTKTNVHVSVVYLQNKEIKIFKTKQRRKHLQENNKRNLPGSLTKENRRHRTVRLYSKWNHEKMTKNAYPTTTSFLVFPAAFRHR